MANDPRFLDGVLVTERGTFYVGPPAPPSPRELEERRQMERMRARYQARLRAGRVRTSDRPPQRAKRQAARLG